MPMQSPLPEVPSLRQLQAAMAAQILPSPDGPADVGALVAWLALPDGVDATDRLHVYSGGYPERIREALAETYPALARLIGPAAFASLAERYAAHVPLTSYNLNDAGAQLGGFLRRDPLANERPWLVDLAGLEWCVAHAFHAREGDPLDPRTLTWSVEEWAAAVLRFQPSVALVTSPWPLLDLWSANNATAIEAQDEQEHIIIRRVGLIVRCEAVSAEEAGVLQRLLDGRSLGDCIDQLDEDPSHVLAWFSRWSSAGMLRAAMLPDAI
jgi:hypothetical protein